jgi:acyl-CoA thioester hydrolase
MEGLRQRETVNRGEETEQTMLPKHEIEIQVRYYETDGQGHVHHANYLLYFELGRVELLRSMGHDYAELERNGVMLVVAEFSCRYSRPCRFGDTLRLQTSTLSARGARIRHRYILSRDGETLAEAESSVACVDRTGRVQRLPEWLREEFPGESPLAC